MSKSELVSLSTASESEGSGPQKALDPRSSEVPPGFRYWPSGAAHRILNCSGAEGRKASRPVLECSITVRLCPRANTEPLGPSRSKSEEMPATSFAATCDARAGTTASGGKLEEVLTGWMGPLHPHQPHCYTLFKCHVTYHIPNNTARQVLVHPHFASVETELEGG